MVANVGSLHPLVSCDFRSLLTQGGGRSQPETHSYATNNDPASPLSEYVLELASARRS